MRHDILLRKFSHPSLPWRKGKCQLNRMQTLNIHGGEATERLKLQICRIQNGK